MLINNKLIDVIVGLAWLNKSAFETVYHVSWRNITGYSIPRTDNSISEINVKKTSSLKQICECVKICVTAYNY